MLLHYYRIDLKEIPKRYKENLLMKVLPLSPLPLRREVERFARYFHREFHFDSMQFDQNDCEPYTAYLIASTEGQIWAGACCFRSRYFKEIDIETDSLEWIWLHPYFRGKGILKSQWSALRADHGDFFVERPLSPAMKSFFLKHAKDSAWHHAIESGDPKWDEIRASLQAKE